MKTHSKGYLIASTAIFLIFLLPVTSAVATTKPKAAGRTAASIPNTILSGSGVPSNSIGIDGDFYIDVKSSNIYGPKIKSKWPTPVSLKGSNGSNGTDGKSGSDGKTISNASTVAGPIGNQGAPGSAGIAGDIGPKGDQGMRGEVGATGAQGIAGPTGAQGAIGLTGASGIQGPAGSGSQGAPGATGASGAQGATGATGSQGPAGSGATGAQGAAGPTGAQGATGSVGATGSTGAQGATGTTGLTGAQGTSGAAGATGATGLTGNVGAAGSTGLQGVQGENGFSQVTSTAILSWKLETDVPGQFTDSTAFASLDIGKIYYVNISVHGQSSKLQGVFSGELIPSSTPSLFVMDQSVSEANIYNGTSSKHTYSFDLHGVIRVGSSVTSFTFRLTDGLGVTVTYPMNLIGKATFIMVGSIA